VTLLFMALGLGGLVVAWRGDRGGFYLLAVLAGTLTFGLIFYLNFRYGYSLAPEIQDNTLHEVRERDYFFMAGFGLWGVLSGMGLTGVWQRVAAGIAHPRRQLLAAPVLLVALLPLAANWAWASRKGDYATRDWAYNLLMSVEPYGILFTNGDNDTFPLWYLQEVEGIRKDVTVIVGQYLYTSWHPKQLQALTSPGRQRPFRPEDAMGIYQVPPEPPSRPILTLSDQEMDLVVGGTTQEELPVNLGGLVFQYPAGTYLDRSDQLALAIIFDSIHERPIYFAEPSAMLGGLGLGPWTIHHGLVSRLVPRDLDAEPPPHLVKTSDGMGGDWFDVQRSLRLMGDVYLHRSFLNRTVWADKSTLNIPWYVYATTVRLADAVSRWEEGTEEQVMALRDLAEGFLVTAQGGYLALPEGAGDQE
jgi:hypothetical protein